MQIRISQWKKKVIVDIVKQNQVLGRLIYATISLLASSMAG